MFIPEALTEKLQGAPTGRSWGTILWGLYFIIVGLVIFLFPEILILTVAAASVFFGMLLFIVGIIKRNNRSALQRVYVRRFYW